MEFGQQLQKEGLAKAKHNIQKSKALSLWDVHSRSGIPNFSASKSAYLEVINLIALDLLVCCELEKFLLN